MALNLVNPDPRYTPPPFGHTPPSGWIYLGAAVAPPVRAPFVRPDAGRTVLLGRLADLADRLRGRTGVRQASVYRAVLIPPSDRSVVRPGPFDVAVLVQTDSPETADTVRVDPAYLDLRRALHAASSRVHELTARCARQLAPVEHTRDGLYLFNHFASADGPPDPAAAVALWEHLAAWYIAETGLRNSTLLAPAAPTGPSDFVLVNHARFDISLPALAAAQFRKPTFRSYVRANLRANHLVAMPALYRLAPPST